jgi:class 3 adenylate cyclase/tetratricopeptide (TPR) repeat protein
VELECAACGSGQPGGARFCNACGAALWTECPSCGAEQPAAAAFCSACGFALEGAPASVPAAHEERRVVTVMFADLAGSTTLGDRLDPEDVREIQSELFEFMNGEVVHHGGMTEKFVGDAVLAIFGVPVAHEDDPERAVRAALGIRDAFPAFAARVREAHGLEVGLRIGVNTGEVVAGREAAARGEHVVSGDAVNIAARLQQHAEVGEVLVGARTRTASQRAVRYEGPRGLEAKGKEALVDAWLAVSADDGPARRGLDGMTAPMIGRDEELAILTAVARRVRSDRAPQLVTLFGQAGVGKSRLLAEFVQRLDDVRVLEGRCLPSGDGITYWPLAEIAKSHAGVLETDSAAVATAKLRAAIETVLPDDAEPVVEATAWTIGLTIPGQVPGTVDSSTVRRRLAGAWSRYLAALGRERFTVMVVEDTHWASEPLLDLLETVADTLADAPVILFCPARPELLETRPSWGAGKQNATSLNLMPLSREQSRELVGALLEGDLTTDDVRQRILERAEGNPFYLEEILRMLVDEGVLEQRDGGWVATERLARVPIPDSVHGVIAARLDLLDASSRNALRRCSVMGTDFWPAAVGVEERAVEMLTRRGLVRERRGSTVEGLREFSFKHAVTRDVAYRTLPRHERRRLHRRVAEWIHEVAPDRTVETAELAAYHLVEARSYGEDDPTVRERAFALLLDAGQSAHARAAFRPAASLLHRALELAAVEHERALALLALGRLDMTEARYPESLERLRDARATAAAAQSAELEAEVLSWESRSAWLLGAWEEAMEAADGAVAALRDLPETSHLARALARRSQLEMLRSHPGAVAHAEEAVEVARRVGDAVAEVNGRINAFSARAGTGGPPDAEDVRAIVELALEAGAIEEAFRAVVNMVWASVGHVHRDEVEQTALAALRAIEARMGPMARVGDTHAPESFGPYLELSLARLVYLPTGRWDKLDAIDVTAAETAVNAGTTVVRLELAAGMAVRRGSVEAARPFLDELLPLALPSDEPQRIVPAAGVGLWYARAVGDGALFRELAEAVLQFDGRQWAQLWAGTAVSRALSAAGEAELLRRFAAVPDEAAATDGSARLTALGLVALADGAAERAVDLLTRAHAIDHSQGAFYDAACVELEIARALAAVGDAAGAEAARARADAVLGPLGVVNPF